MESRRCLTCFLITPTDACLGFLDPAKLARLDANLHQTHGDLASKTIALHARIYGAATQFDAGSEKVLALAVDGSGDLFVGETSVLNSPGTYRVLEYSPAGEQIASFGDESSSNYRCPRLPI